MGYPNGSDGAAPFCHAGMFSGACFDCRLYLLNSLRTRRGMPLTDRLERRGGLFLKSASTLFFGGGRFGRGELPEDNSSSATASLSSGHRVASLSCIFRSVHLPDEPVGGRFLVTDGQHGSAIHPYVWLVPPALSPYPDANEGTGLPDTDLMDCWP